MECTHIGLRTLLLLNEIFKKICNLTYYCFNISCFFFLIFHFFLFLFQIFFHFFLFFSSNVILGEFFEQTLLSFSKQSSGCKKNISKSFKWANHFPLLSLHLLHYHHHRCHHRHHYHHRSQLLAVHLNAEDRIC